MRTCYLVGAAPEAQRISPETGDFTIAADGGLEHLRAWGIRPDFLVGDFDSLRSVPEDIPQRRVSAQKDETDLRLAFEEGIARGYRNFVITGAQGGRPDHTMANYQLLLRAARMGAFAVMYGAGFRAAAIDAGGMLQLEGRGTVSVFSLEARSAGVVLEGLQYALPGGILYGDHPLGVSNFLIGSGSISVAEGALLVFWQEEIEALANT